MSRGTPDTAGLSELRLRVFHPLRTAFPIPFGSSLQYLVQSITPQCTHRGLGSFPFARRYSGNRCYFLFLRVLRCFSSPGSLPHTMDSCTDASKLAGFPIQKSLDRWIFAPPQSLSQLITSFIGSQCLGIHPTLFLA